MDVGSRVETLIADVVESEGFELVHVSFEPRGAKPLLRIYIDKPGGVTISDCSRVSRRVSVLLDVEDVVAGHYLLEVSSPGIERPLFKEDDYRRFRKREIRLVTSEKVDGRRKFTGFIEDFADGTLQLETDDGRHDIPFIKIKKANLVHHF